jgi:hypothetical protein
LLPVRSKPFDRCSLGLVLAKDRPPSSSPSVCSWLASRTTSDGLIKPEGRKEPRSPSRNGDACFFPLPPSGGIPRGRQKSSLTPSSAGVADLKAAGRSLPGPRIAIEARQRPGEYNGDHRHLHRVRPSSSGPRKTTTRRPTIASFPVSLNSARPGRKPPATAIANISRSSSTTRVSQRRSTPRWSRSTARRVLP